MHTKPKVEPVRGNRKPRIGILLASLILMMVFVIAFSIHLRNSRLPWEGFQKPDDLKAARELLATKFAGSRYFHFTADQEETDFPFVPVSTVLRQAEDIRHERSLSASQMEKLYKVIDSLSEPSPSRVSGVTRVNVLQLNMALDEMH